MIVTKRTKMRKTKKQGGELVTKLGHDRRAAVEDMRPRHCILQLSLLRHPQATHQRHLVLFQRGDRQTALFSSSRSQEGNLGVKTVGEKAEPPRKMKSQTKWMKMMKSSRTWRKT